MDPQAHPAVALAVAAVAVRAALALRPQLFPSGRVMSAGLPLAAGLILVGYLGLVAWYTLQASFFDPAEPTIPAVAWAFWSGQELYPALDAPERYVHVYGPALYLAHALALSAAGPSIAASKAVGASAAAGGLLLLVWALRRQADARTALVASAGAVLVYGCFANVSWWTRADGLLILVSAAGVASSRARPAWAAGAAIGVLAGLAVNLKLTGPIYLLPVVAWGVARHGAGILWPAAGAAAVLACLPFLHPRIDAATYLAYVQLAAGAGLEWSPLRRTLEWAALLLVPVLLAHSSGPRDRPHAWAHIGLIAGMAAVTIAAAKPGGGPLHLLPFVPVVAWLAVPFSRQAAGPSPLARAAMVAAVAVSLTVAIPSQMRLVRTVNDRALETAVADVSRGVEELGGRRVAVGYANTSHLAHARVEAVFRTGEYWLDAPAVQEHRLAGLDLPEATLERIVTCYVETWMIPAGGEPFLVPSAYAPRGPALVFSDAFRAAFSARYERTGRAGHFDLWTCRGGGGGGR